MTTTQTRNTHDRQDGKSLLEESSKKVMRVIADLKLLVML